MYINVELNMIILNTKLQSTSSPNQKVSVDSDNKKKMGHVKKHDYHQNIQIKIVLLIIIQNQMKKKITSCCKS